MSDEAPKPDPVPPLESAKARLAQQRARALSQAPKPGKLGVGDILMGSACVVTGLGIVFAIVIPGLLSSQGARYSVRIEWERRGAEIDAIADQARRDGKLPPAPEAGRRE